MSESFVRALGAAVAALAVWLTVRIINRRERWAIRIALGLIAVSILYVASFGPACWISSRATNGKKSLLPFVYAPILGCISRDRDSALDTAIFGYAGIGAAPCWVWAETYEKLSADGTWRHSWSWDVPE